MSSTWRQRRILGFIFLKKCHHTVTSMSSYVHHTGASLFGINLHGSPWQPVHYTRGFGLDRGQALLDKWDLIPSDTDILITHGPPLGYGDFTSSGYRVGCSELLQVSLSFLLNNNFYTHCLDHHFYELHYLIILII